LSLQMSDSILIGAWQHEHATLQRHLRLSLALTRVDLCSSVGNWYHLIVRLDSWVTYIYVYRMRCKVSIHRQARIDQSETNTSSSMWLPYCMQSPSIFRVSVGVAWYHIFEHQSTWIPPVHICDVKYGWLGNHTVGSRSIRLEHYTIEYGSALDQNP
jgi:hypothetical protein